MSDLIERLRSNAGETAQTATDRLLLEAAARLFVLEAEIERLRLSCKGEPIPMVLFCPACGVQHIDEAEEPLSQHGGFLPPEPGDDYWDNPPHRSHLCHGCGHIWRPADVPTTGVQAVQTKGKADSPLAAGISCKGVEGWRMVPVALDDAMVRAGAREYLNLPEDATGADHAKAMYHAMLAAAPVSPSPLMDFGASQVRHQPSAATSPAGSDPTQAPCPARGEIRVIDGQRCRFIERELEGDKWEILGREQVKP